MKPEVFKKHVDLYSADLSRWPVDLVKPALALMDVSAEAARYFNEALKIDDLLRADAGDAAPSPALEGAIMKKIAALPQKKQRESRTAWRPALLFAPGGSLLAVAILGFFIGLQPAIQTETLLDPAFYAPEQIIAGDNLDAYEEELF